MQYYLATTQKLPATTKVIFNNKSCLQLEKLSRNYTKVARNNKKIITTLKFHLNLLRPHLIK